jgi:hypothetical protein
MEKGMASYWFYQTTIKRPSPGDLNSDPVFLRLRMAASTAWRSDKSKWKNTARCAKFTYDGNMGL